MYSVLHLSISCMIREGLTRMWLVSWVEFRESEVSFSGFHLEVLLTSSSTFKEPPIWTLPFLFETILHATIIYLLYSTRWTPIFLFHEADLRLLWSIRHQMSLMFHESDPYTPLLPLWNPLMHSTFYFSSRSWFHPLGGLIFSCDLPSGLALLAWGSHFKCLVAVNLSL